MTRDEARARDAADPLRHFRGRFQLPPGVYLDGNSLGPLPRATVAAVDELVQRQWGERLIRSWNEGWIEAPGRIGAKIARLIGAEPDEVIVADSTSVNIFKLLRAVLAQSGERRVILGEAGNFPTDLHIAEGVVGASPGACLAVAPRDALADRLDRGDVAVALLSHVHYRTAERFDLSAWTARAHAAGAATLWDLSHSVGAVPVDLNAAGADLAVGCGYKFLNGGPGAPAFLFVARRWQDRLRNPISGWFGHAQPFAFEDGSRPATGMARWLAGTPPMLAMAGLETGVDLMLEADPAQLAAKSAQLFDVIAAIGVAHGLRRVSPADPAHRGSHIAFAHDAAYGLCQALIARGVVGDFRTPDVLRFGLTPLYLGFEDLLDAGEAIAAVLAAGAHLDPRYGRRNAVT